MNISLYARLKDRFAQSTLKKRFESSMGLKFIGALTIVISVLMVVGTIFIARILLADQERSIEQRGRDMGMFLGKAAADHIIAGDAIGIDTLASEAVKSSQDMLYTVILDAAGSGVLSSLMGSFSHDDGELRDLLRKAAPRDSLRAREIVRQEMDPIEVVVDIRQEGGKIGSVVMGFSRDGIRKNIREIVWLLLGTSVVIVLLLSLMVAYMVNRMIIAQTRESESVASNIASGNLLQSVRVRSTDEVGRLGRGLNRMIIGLKQIITSVRDAAGKVGTASVEVREVFEKVRRGSKEQAESVEEAASSVNEMHFALKEIATNVEELHATSEQTSSAAIETAASVAEVAKTMNDLSVSIEEVSAAITQMSAAIQQTAEHVEQLSSAAEETAASSVEISASVREVETIAGRSQTIAESVAADAEHLGMRSIEKTIAGMKQIESNARRTAGVINRLGERAESIGGILNVIEDITDQTGLLALNAAILAAQAGEHGKGFAVVASEIRELANRTAASTGEIGKLIASVQEETREAVGAVQEEVSIIEQGTKLSEQAGDALKKILTRANESRDMSRSISKASSEQARGVKQVSEAIEQINAMTQQIAKAASEQRGGSRQITQATEKMRELTRFVRKTAQEQAKGTRDITVAIETISAKIGLVNRSSSEMRTGSELIVQAIERIKSIAKENAEQAAQLQNTIDLLATQSVTLSKEIDRFKA